MKVEETTYAFGLWLCESPRTNTKIMNKVKKLLQSAIKEEREECARIAEKPVLITGNFDTVEFQEHIQKMLAQAIRNRGENNEQD